MSLSALSVLCVEIGKHSVYARFRLVGVWRLLFMYGLVISRTV